MFVLRNYLGHAGAQVFAAQTLARKWIGITVTLEVTYEITLLQFAAC